MRYIGTNDVCADAIHNSTPPTPCSAASRRCVANHSSAINPTRKGDSIAPSAVVPAARPISFPEKWRCCPSQVPSVTYQTPQTKYSRNIITDSRALICNCTQSPLGRSRNVAAHTKLFPSSARGLRTSGTVEPEIDWFLDAGRRLERHGDFASLARRGVTRVQRFHHHQSVFAGGLRGFLAADATREMGQLLRRTVVPELLEDRVGPALGRRRFFDRVAVAVLAVGGHGVTHV